jgi:hypothetical protein
MLPSPLSLFPSFFHYLAILNYVPGPYSAVFGPGANDRHCINITLVVDSITEGSEDFTVSLNLPSAWYAQEPSHLLWSPL